MSHERRMRILQAIVEDYVRTGERRWHSATIFKYPVPRYAMIWQL